jgi:hypothetical protein
MAYQVFIKFPSAGSWVELTNYSGENLVMEGYSLRQSLCNSSLQFEKSTFDFECRYNYTLFYDLFTSNQSNPSEYIKGKVMDGATTVFLGYLLPVESLNLGNEERPASLSFVDMSLAFDKTVGVDINLTGNKWLYKSSDSTSIIKTLVARAYETVTVSAPNLSSGTIGSSYSSSNIWLPAFSCKADDNLLDVLKQVCYENRVFMSFSGSGALTLTKGTGLTTPTYTFSESAQNILDGTFTATKDDLSQDSVKVTYSAPDSFDGLRVGALDVAGYDYSTAEAFLANNKVPVSTFGALPRGFSANDFISTFTVEIPKSYNGLSLYQLTPKKIKVEYYLHFQTGGIGFATPTGRKGPFYGSYDVATDVYTYSTDGLADNLWIEASNTASGTHPVVVGDDSIEFTLVTDYPWGSSSSDHNIFYLSKVWAEFSGVARGADKTYRLDGTRKVYVDVSTKYVHSSLQAKNLAHWINSASFQHGRAYTLSSYEDVALGTVCTMSLPSKGVTYEGYIHSKTSSREHDLGPVVYSYTLKESDEPTVSDPAPVVLQSKTAPAPVPVSTFSESGLIQAPIVGQQLPEATAFMDANQSIAGAGLYLFQDKMGFWDGSQWKTVISSDGNAVFQGTVYATAGEFSGKLIASSGALGGFTSDFYPVTGGYVEGITYPVGTPKSTIYGLLFTGYGWAPTPFDAYQPALRIEGTYGSTPLSVVTYSGSNQYFLYGATGSSLVSITNVATTITSAITIKRLYKASSLAGDVIPARNQFSTLGSPTNKFSSAHVDIMNTGAINASSVSVSGTSYLNGNVEVQAGGAFYSLITTDASSSTSAGFEIAGGLAVAKKLYVGTSINGPATGLTGTALNLVSGTTLGIETLVSGATAPTNDIFNGRIALRTDSYDIKARNLGFWETYPDDVFQGW